MHTEKLGRTVTLLNNILRRQILSYILSYLRSNYTEHNAKRLVKVLKPISVIFFLVHCLSAKMWTPNLWESVHRCAKHNAASCAPLRMAERWGGARRLHAPLCAKQKLWCLLEWIGLSAPGRGEERKVPF